MARVAVTISLSDDERAELEALSRRRKTSQGLARRARIVLAAAEGLENKEIAVRLEASADTVGKWRRRYAAEGLDGLYDEPRPGAPRQIGDDAIAEAVRLTLEETPPDATHWSLRSMARASGHAPSTIHRIWRAFGLQPHRSETFKLSSDPFFVEKVRDIVGLYLAPPDRHRRRGARSRPGPFPAPLADAPRAGGAAQPTTSATARPLSSRPSTSPRERSSANVSRAIGPESSANSSTSSRRTSLLISTSTSSWTTTGPTRPRRSATGSPNGRAGRPISHPPAPPAQPGRALVRAADRQADQARRPSLHQGVGAHQSSTTSTRQTRTPNPSNGPNPPMTSSAPSSASASEQSKSLNSRRKSCELRNRDTSGIAS